MNRQCEHYRELAADAVNGVLDAASVRELEGHAAGCAECRGYLEALKREDLLLGELVGRLDAGMDGRQERLVDAIKGQHKQTRIPMKWSINMRSPMTKMAAAAVIVFAVVLGVVLFPGNNVTFAKVVAPILNARTVIVDMVIGGGEDSPVLHEIIVDTRIRRTISNMPGLTQILDLEGGKMLVLDDGSKTAAVVNIQGEVQQGTKNYVEFLRQVIRQMQDGQVQELGQRDMDGNRVVGFVGKGQNEGVTIWADAKTGHPIQIEFTIGQDFRAVMKNFQFDVPVDASLVSMEAPAGYTLEETDFDLSQVTEADFVESLRIWAEIIGDGVFPDVIGSEATMQQMPTLVQKLIERNVSEEEGTRLGMSFGLGMMFYQTLNLKGVECGYCGAGVKLGDAGSAIFWYRPKGGATCRVVYGDLSVKDVEAADLPK